MRCNVALGRLETGERLRSKATPWRVSQEELTNLPSLEDARRVPLTRGARLRWVKWFATLLTAPLDAANVNPRGLTDRSTTPCQMTNPQSLTLRTPTITYASSRDATHKVQHR